MSCMSGESVMWVVYFQADGEMRHEVGRYRFLHTAEYEAEGFKQRMTNPDVGLWWVWIEEV
jgi:hypothetical protein